MKSLKKHLISHFACMPCVEGMENNEVILVTAIGLIRGTLATVTDDVTDSVNILTAIADKLTNAYREEHNLPDTAVINDNDGYIALKNVTIQNGQNTTSLPFLCVFFDQIIGVSVGNINCK